MSSANEIFARILYLLSVVSGGLELRLETPQEKEGEGQQQQQGGTKLYDADDEEGESSEVILSRGSGAIREAAAVTATPLLPHQDLVFKRKRPNSLTRHVLLSPGVNGIIPLYLQGFTFFSREGEYDEVEDRAEIW